MRVEFGREGEDAIEMCAVISNAGIRSWPAGRNVMRMSRAPPHSADPRCHHLCACVL